jgi:methylated-DNA-protein-cysteine methyltransferase-like protein
MAGQYQSLTEGSGDLGLTRKRVISAKGIISPRGDEGQGVARQKTALEAEGVEVTTLAGGGGEKVDVRRYGWFPEQVDL